jgi:hypothetical protein
MIAQRAVRGLFVMLLVGTAVTAGTALPAEASCGRKIHTGSYPLWTHEEPGQVRGELIPPVVQSPAWPRIPGSPAQFLWKSPGGSQPLTATPVVFTSETFFGCVDAAYTGLLKISADDYYTAYLNGVLVASCVTGCYSTYAVAQVPVSAVNQLVVFAWNIVGPAMIQYELAY